jgi:hypothetical protein
MLGTVGSGPLGAQALSTCTHHFALKLYSLTAHSGATANARERQ